MREVMRLAKSTPWWCVPAVLIVAFVGVRIALVASGNFYWDDLILIGRASDHSVLSASYLFANHDGHFMPAAFLVAGASTVIAPLQWVLPAATLVLFALSAAVAVLRLLVIITGRDRIRRPIMLAAFAFYLFTPMAVPAFVWWSAGLNSLPMQAAMAWIVGDAILFCRGVGTRRRRVIVIRSTIIFIVGLAFFEKSLFIVPVAFAVAALWVRWRLPTGDDWSRNVPLTPLTVAFTRARTLWASLIGVSIVWLVIFLSVTDGVTGRHSLTQTAKLMWHAINDALVPGLIGGPWRWERWIPSPPMADTPTLLIVVAWVLVGGAVGYAIWSRRGAGVVVACAATYVVGAQLPVLWNRSGTFTATELAQTLRYLPDTALVVAVAIALIGCSPARATCATDPSASRRLAPTVAVVVALICSAAASTWTFQTSWADNPTGSYLDNARADFAEHPGQVMFDQPVPLEVLLPLASPNNQISRVFGRLPDGPRIVTSASELTVLDNDGHLVAGGVSPVRSFPAGRGTCSTPEVSGPSEIGLDGPLMRWRWVVALSYCANAPGVATLRLGDGPATTFLVDAGLHMVYVQLDGTGRTMQLTPGAGLKLHVGAGRVGQVAAAKLLG